MDIDKCEVYEQTDKLVEKKTNDLKIIVNNVFVPPEGIPPTIAYAAHAAEAMFQVGTAAVTHRVLKSAKVGCAKQDMFDTPCMMVKAYTARYNWLAAIYNKLYQLMWPDTCADVKRMDLEEYVRTLMLFADAATDGLKTAKKMYDSDPALRLSFALGRVDVRYLKPLRVAMEGMKSDIFKEFAGRLEKSSVFNPLPTYLSMSSDWIETTQLLCCLTAHVLTMLVGSAGVRMVPNQKELFAACTPMELERDSDEFIIVHTSTEDI